MHSWLSGCYASCFKKGAFVNGFRFLRDMPLYAAAVYHVFNTKAQRNAFISIVYAAYQHIVTELGKAQLECWIDIIKFELWTFHDVTQLKIHWIRDVKTETRQRLSFYFVCTRRAFVFIKEIHNIFLSHKC